MNFMVFLVPKKMLHLVFMHFFCLIITAEISKIKKGTQGGLYFTFNALLISQGIKCCHLQEKNGQLFGILRFFRFLIDRVLFRLLFESSLIGSSSVFSVIRLFYWVISLSFQHAAIYSQNMFLLFFIKADILFYIIFLKRSLRLTITLTCFNDFSKTDSQTN